MLAITTAAAIFNVGDKGIAKNHSLLNTRTLWLIIVVSIALFFSSLLFLIMNYHYNGRSWWKFVGWGGTSSGGVTGLAIMLSEAQDLLPMACGMWALAIIVAVLLSMDSRYEHYACEDEEVNVPEYAMGTPHNPRARNQRH